MERKANVNGTYGLRAYLPLVVVWLILLLPASGAAAQTAGGTIPVADSSSEHRSAGLDVVILLDKSLSMAPFFSQVKAYVAGKVLEPILIPGDRLILDAFYGKVDRLYDGTIRSEADKAAAIRTLRAVKADGRFTDIGSALDAAQQDLNELGKPDRPKYVLLITDEQQEAPPESPYAVKNYRLDHPALQYVKRVDLGRFRAITVGFGVGAKVDAATPEVMKLLTEVPTDRMDGSSSGSSSATGGGGVANVQAGTGSSSAAYSPGYSTAEKPAAGSNAAGSNAAGSNTAGSNTAERGSAMPVSPAIVWSALAVLLLALAGATRLLLKSIGSKKKQDGQRRES